jgi:hypothetical protein
MKLRFLPLLALGASLAAPVSAAILVEQPLGAWTEGWCSPCNSAFDDIRVFARFTTAADTVVDSATFDVKFTSDPGDVSVSIWDTPFGTELYSATFEKSDFTLAPNGSVSVLTVALPDWVLAAGSYSLSLFGRNGTTLGWGTDFRTGDDTRWFPGGPTLLSDDAYVGFSLSGTVVPEPGTWALMLGGLVATGTLVRRRLRT